MPHSAHVHVTGLMAVDDLPGRFGDAGLTELAQALGAPDGGAPRERLRAAIQAMPMAELAPRMLDLVLLQPPIPAGCEALVHAMRDPETAPWRTHEVAEDRLWLWYCHALLHDALPDAFAAPEVTRVDVEVVGLSAAVRPPGPRTPSHDRVAFLASVLQQGPGAWSARPAEVASWAYDELWAVEVGARRKPDSDELTRLGAPADEASSGRCVAVSLSGWMIDTHAAGLAVDQTWTVQV